MGSKGFREAKGRYLTNKDWLEFSRWELEHKKEALRSLTPERAFEVFAEVMELASLEPEKLKALRLRRIEHMANIRRRLQGARF